MGTNTISWILLYHNDTDILTQQGYSSYLPYVKVYVTGFVALMDLHIYKRGFYNTIILSTFPSLDDTTNSSIENTIGISSF